MSGASGLAAAREIRRLQREMTRIIERMSEVRVHRAKPSVGDIPLLIRALSFHDLDVVKDAQKALCAVSGMNYGLDAMRWESWWNANQEDFMKHHAEEQAARALFFETKHDILTGHWEELHERLARELREEFPLALFVRNVKRVSRPLRRVYRDACATDTWVEKNEGVIVVDWGQIVFEINEFPVVREPDGWKFARLPWSRRIRRRSKQPAPQETPTRVLLPLNENRSVKRIERRFPRRSYGWVYVLLFVTFGLPMMYVTHPLMGCGGFFLVLLCLTLFLPIRERFTGLGERLRNRRRERRALESEKTSTGDHSE